MDDGGPTASIIFFILLLFADMFFYGFGSAIHCLNIKDVEKRAKEGQDKKSIRLKAVMTNPTQYVNTSQVLMSLINIIMGGYYLKIWLAAIKRFLLPYMGPEGAFPVGAGVVSILSLVVTTMLLLYIVLTFGVLFPKRLAARYPEKWAYFCINPAWLLIRLFFPFTWLISLTARGTLRLFGIREDQENDDVTEEEIISMVNEGHEQGVLLATEAEMITNIFEFGDKEARDIMTHRNSIVAVEGDLSLKEAISFMLDENNSRFPVYEGNIDHIIGILHLRDAMKKHAQDENLNLPVKEIEGILRLPVFIPETKNIDGLFQMMQSSKTQMVIVVDEYGQTSGLIAMEDILEEIVGNIMDEYDEDEAYIAETGNADEYIIEGKTPLEELEERFGIAFHEEEFETLNGFLISKLDKIPEENEEFDIDVDGYHFRILSVENKMIQSVLVTKIKDGTQEAERENNGEERGE